MSCFSQHDEMTRFELFTSLPAELRLQIWSYNNPPPRVVPFPRTKRQGCGARESEDGIVPSVQQSTTSTACPSNLHACQESRKEALRRYHQLYEAASRGYSDFFNCAKDILLFDAHHSLPFTNLQLSSIISLVSPQAVRSIRNIAITEAVFSDIQATSRVRPCSVGLRTEDVLRQLCTWLPSLQHIIIVHSSSNSNHHDEGSGPVPRGGGPVYSYDGDVYLVKPPVRYRFTERRLQNALDVVAQEAGAGWARPAWSIQTLRARPSVEGLAKMAMRNAERPLQEPSPAGTDLDDKNQSQAPPASATRRRPSDAGCFARSSSSTPITPQQCLPRWTFVDLASATGSILDHASSRLAFYRRHHYWG